MEKASLFIAIQLFLLILLIIAFIFFFKVKRAIALERRITKFSTISINDKSLSFFDYLLFRYNKLISKITNVLLKSKLIVSYSKTYEKYIDKTKIVPNKKVDIISNKILISIIAIIITILSDILRRQSINPVQILIALIIGFFIPDIILRITYKSKQKQIEQDLLKAVLIMSNAFKSGRSIMQAVEIVSKELDGPISDEFKKMYIEEFEDSNESFMDFMLDLIPRRELMNVLKKGKKHYYIISSKYR